MKIITLILMQHYPGRPSKPIEVIQNQELAFKAYLQLKRDYPHNYYSIEQIWMS